MVRSLWTAATGMVAQQTNIDTIANNLANVIPRAIRLRQMSLSLFYIKAFKLRPLLPMERTNLLVLRLVWV